MTRCRERDSTIPQRARPTCYGCCRPISHCVCRLVSPFAAHCNILILQHPHERKKYHSTAKLLTKAVTNCRLLRGIEFDPLQLVEQLAGQEVYLLFPSNQAADCRKVKLNLGSTVIVVDGTWEEARKILFRNTLLHQLPHLSFTDSVKSNYRIRKQPRENYLSTIESVAHLLRVNSDSSSEPELSARYDLLTEGFNRMVEQQLSYFPRSRPDL